MKNRVKKVKRGVRPEYRFTWPFHKAIAGYRRALPFRRSPLVITILAAFDMVFLVPAVMTFMNAWSGASEVNDLFDLVAVLFQAAWLLGWMTAPLILTSILLVLLFGREVLRIRPGELELHLGIAGLGIAATYRLAHVRNLRLETPEKKSGHSWRATHAVFDYGANPVRLGSAQDDQQEFVFKSRAHRKPRRSLAPRLAS